MVDENIPYHISGRHLLFLFLYFPLSESTNMDIKFTWQCKNFNHQCLHDPCVNILMVCWDYSMPRIRSSIPTTWLFLNSSVIQNSVEYRFRFNITQSKEHNNVRDLQIFLLLITSSEDVFHFFFILSSFRRHTSETFQYKMRGVPIDN